MMLPPRQKEAGRAAASGAASNADAQSLNSSPANKARIIQQIQHENNHGERYHHAVADSHAFGVRMPDAERQIRYPQRVGAHGHYRRSQYDGQKQQGVYDAHPILGKQCLFELFHCGTPITHAPARPRPGAVRHFLQYNIIPDRLYQASRRRCSGKNCMPAVLLMMALSRKISECTNRKNRGKELEVSAGRALAQAHVSPKADGRASPRNMTSLVLPVILCRAFFSFAKGKLKTSLIKNLQRPAKRDHLFL